MENTKLQAEQAKMENENVQNDKDRENKLEIAELNAQTDLQIARMKDSAETRKMATDIETTHIKDSTDKEKVAESKESTASKERTEFMKAAKDERNAEADRQSNEKIAKEKPNNTSE